MDQDTLVSNESGYTTPNTNSVKINVEVAKKINFACHQNSFAFIKELVINNFGDSPIQDIVVTMESSPEFLKRKKWRFDVIGSKAIMSVPTFDKDVELDGQLLFDLNESIRGSITFTVTTGEATLCTKTVSDISLLAYNEWGGAHYMPEMLATFVTPNNPAIDRILGDASRILRRANKDDAIDGYNSNSRERVWEIGSAIYAAIANLGLTYVAPPASFEQNGQKIRLPDAIMENKTSTCLDTTLLFCSVLEQAGLNPVIVLVQGHAMAGFWLQPEDFASIISDEPELLRTRVSLKDLVLLETTYLTQKVAPNFSKAIDQAVHRINPDNDDKFEVMVDIRRARSQKIIPITGKVSGYAGEAAPEADVEHVFEAAPVLPSFDLGIEEKEDDTPLGRVDKWLRKLLDLTARNPLISFKPNKATLKLIRTDLGLLEDKLADSKKIKVGFLPTLNGPGQDEDIFRQRYGSEQSLEYTANALERNELVVEGSKDDVNKRAVEIYRKAQTSMQEGGSNTLYLALGFLRWKRNEKDPKPMLSPLILLPVTLNRKSARSGFSLTSHDDEARFNTTLLEMLRTDFEINITGLDGQLPTDSSGIDVLGVWDIVRKRIKDTPGMEVVEDAYLGHFSFAKYLLWKDLVDRTAALKKSPIVNHLIETPKEPFDSDIDFVDPSDLDKKYAPSDILAPLPADSSQMAAIATADRGKDFIIIGPPGTGKSQTISNLISHLIGTGKSVLFVSEKTAALDVVYRRLEHVGLGRFCLALHSNKSKKSEVLGQLRRSYESQDVKIAETWEKEANRLKSYRDKLNVLVDHLHMVRENGMTAHYAMGVKIRDQHLAARVTLDWSPHAKHSVEHLANLREIVDTLRVHAESVGDMRHTPFSLVDAADWSPQWEKELVDLADVVASAASRAKEAKTRLCAALSISLPDERDQRLQALHSLCGLLITDTIAETGFALSPQGSQYISKLEDSVSHLKRYASCQTELSCSYSEQAWREIDGEALIDNWNEASQQFWPKSFFTKKMILKNLKSQGCKGKPDVLADARVLIQLKEEGEAIDELGQDLESIKVWKGHKTPADSAGAIKSFAQNVLQCVNQLGDTAEQITFLRSKLCALIENSSDMLYASAPVGMQAVSYMKAMDELNNLLDSFKTKAGTDVHEALEDNTALLDAIISEAGRIGQNRQELRTWCTWRSRRQAAIQENLLRFVEAIDNGDIPANEINETFEAAYCTWWSHIVISEDEVIRQFTAAEHNETITRFRELDTEFQSLTAQYIAAKLSGHIPSQRDTKKSAGWGVLKRELTKRSNHMAVRQLIQEIPDVLTKLSPCMMMSPLSVAQYLPPDQDLFDVVIFDEASQITVWDAVGAIARGKQVIIAGDPKQMPPTNFFNRKDDEYDDSVSTGEGDLESILDEMESASIPSINLNLHYRSRRESLIAFSNHHYYDQSLVTFPAPVHPDKGVSLVRPDGHYARGSGRFNQGEAKAIVEDIVTRLTHDDPAVREKSIGVVTFNTEQQTLIQDLLDKERAKNPALERYFGEEVIEPVFVKNLETVQGDERDVILFSVTYGPDINGHVTLNFGPINKQGGQRRLNVAMSRSRYEMKVFSTLKAQDISLDRSQAVGVRDLKEFLKYAEYGPTYLGSESQGSMGDYDSPFESAVAQALANRGYELHPQVGVSSFRIDLGVVNPDSAGHYLAGIECDGAMYHSSAFARERDKIRQNVLEGLGWDLIRIWSTDWWVNPSKEIDVVVEKLEALRSTWHEEQERAREALEKAREKRLEAEMTATEGDDDIFDDDNESELTPETADEEEVTTLADDEMEEAYAEQVMLDTAVLPYYAFAGSTANPSAADVSDLEIIAGLIQIVDAEGPVLAERAYKLYLRSCGIARLGRTLKSQLNKALNKAIRADKIVADDEAEKGGLIHCTLTRPGSPKVTLRLRGERSFDEVPLSEIYAAFKTTDVGSDSFGDEAHYRRVTELFGVGRLTNVVKNRIKEALLIYL